ncbi:MAG: T9SS type A sorting domain-containing protein [Bacteroidetes bacterium]|nr:T9SS type A sorting domain-containing protein [Bacteroidota bacterium]
MYKNAKVQLWAAKTSIAVDARQWYRVKKVGDTTFVGNGDTMVFTMDTTSRFICRNVNNCTCGGTYYSSYTQMASIIVVDSPSVPQYWFIYDSVICSGTPTNIFTYTNSSLSGLRIQYFRDDTPNVTGSITGTAALGPLGVTLTNTTGTAETVRIFLRLYKGSTYFDSKSFYVKVLPAAPSGTDHCSFPSKPQPGPNIAVDVNTYGKGAQVQFLVDTTVIADTVKWYKVVGDDTSYIGKGYSVGVTMDTTAKFLARAFNVCSCNGSIYASDYALIANNTVSINYVSHIIPLQIMDTIASGTGINILTKTDTTIKIEMFFYRDNANVTGSTIQNTIDNYTGTEGFDAILTNTTNVPQRIRYKIYSRPYAAPGSVYGDTYTGYFIVMPSSFTAPPGNHCYIPSRTGNGSAQVYTYSPGANVYLDLNKSGFVSGAIWTFPNVTDAVEWFKVRGQGDTVFVGDVTPVSTTVDTTIRIFTVSRNVCYWSDSSKHVYRSVPTFVGQFNKGTGSVDTPTHVNNRENVCSNSAPDITYTGSSTSLLWYRNNPKGITGAYVSVKNSTTSIHTDSLIRDTLPYPVKVYYVGIRISSPVLSSNVLDSFTVYPDCANWANFSTVIHALKDSICPGDTATLTADTVPGIGSHYVWSTGDTTKTIHPTAQGTYTVTVTNSCGCSASASLQLVVASAPSLVSAHPSICNGDSAILTASEGVVYVWSNGDSTASIIARVPDIYTVTATNSFGCTASISDTVQVHNYPVLSFDSAKICIGDTGVIKVFGADSYLWSTGDSTSTIHVGDTLLRWVIGTTNGCSSTDSIRLSVFQRPAIYLDSVILIKPGTAALLSVEGGYSYSWNTGDISSSISTFVPGSYSVTATNTIGCTASATSRVSIDTASYFEAMNAPRLTFEQNVGQLGNSIIKFQTCNNGVYYRFLPDGISYARAKSDTLTDSTTLLIWNMSLLGMNSGTSLLPDSLAGDTSFVHHVGFVNPFFGRINYYIGNDSTQWFSNVPTFQGIEYQNVYDSIDLKYYGDSTGDLEYDFVVKPGGRIADIKMNYQGVDSVTIDSSGNAIVGTFLGQVTEMKPYAYQIIGGIKTQVSVVFRMDTGKTLGFQAVGSYDTTTAIVIDPLIQVWNNYFGNTNASSPSLVYDPVSLTADQSNVYITGHISGDYLSGTFIPIIPSINVYPNMSYPFGSIPLVFIAKYDNLGHYVSHLTVFGAPSPRPSPLYDINLGMEEYTIPFHIKVDANHRVYVCGMTSQNGFPIIPTTTNSLCPSTNTYTDCFLGVFDFTSNPNPNIQNGRAIYTNEFGGSRREYALRLALDDPNAAYPKVFVTGFTESSDMFSTSYYLNSASPCLRNQDVFMAELDPFNINVGYLSGAVWGSNAGNCTSATLNQDWGRDIAYTNGKVYVAGFADGNNGFPSSTSGTGIPLSSTNRDGFFTVLNPTNPASISYSTSVGSSDGDDEVFSMDLNSAGDVYLLGLTTSQTLTTTTPISNWGHLYNDPLNPNDGFIKVLNASNFSQKYQSYAEYAVVGGNHGFTEATSTIAHPYCWGGIAVSKRTGNVFFTTVNTRVMTNFEDCSVQGRYNNFRLLELSGSLDNAIGSSQFGTGYPVPPYDVPRNIHSPSLVETAASTDIYSGYQTQSGVSDVFPLSPQALEVTAVLPKKELASVGSYIKLSAVNIPNSIDVTASQGVCFDGSHYSVAGGSSFIELDANPPLGLHNSAYITYTWYHGTAVSSGTLMGTGGYGTTAWPGTPITPPGYAFDNSILRLLANSSNFPNTAYPGKNEFTVVVTEVDPNGSTANDCVLSTIHFTVYVNGATVVTSSSNNTVCSGAPITITAQTNTQSPTATYTWTPAVSGNPSSFTITPTSTVTYNVTVSDHGCSNTAAISINVGSDCCDATNSPPPGAITYNFQMYNQSISSFIAMNPSVIITSGGVSQFVSIPNNKVSMGGNIVFDQNFTFLGVGSNEATILLSSSAIITINSGVTLTLDKTYLETCGTDMWNGIVIEPGGKLIIDNSSALMDAKIGITVKDGGVLIADNSAFLRNDVSVKIQGNVGRPDLTSDFSANSRINACKFIYNPTAMYGTLNEGPLKAPYAGKYPTAGIQVVGGKDVRIGDNRASNPNTFSGLCAGISNLWSQVFVDNNYFEEIRDYNNANYYISPQGCAVCSYGGNFTNNQALWGAPTVVQTAVSKPNSNSPVNFLNCDWAISSKWAELIAMNNSIKGNSHSWQALDQRSFGGVYTGSVMGTRINVLNNYMKYVDIGVQMSTNIKALVALAGNEIYVNPPMLHPIDGSHPKATYGILEAEVLNSSPSSLVIGGSLPSSANKIYGGLSNYKLSSTKNASIMGNYFNLLDNVQVGVGVIRTGIDAQNCNNLQISGENHFTGTTNTFDDVFTGTSIIPFSSNRKAGVNLNNTSHSEICSNYFESLGYATSFQANNDETRLRSNDFNNHKYAIVVTNIGQFGVIGDQGDLTHENNGNNFHLATSYSSGYQTYSASPASLFTNKIYYGSTTSPTPNTGPYPILIVPGSSNSPQCCEPDNPPFATCSLTFKMALNPFKIAVAKGDIYAFADSSRHAGALWLAQRKLYRELRSDGELLSSDTTYQNFYKRAASGELGPISVLEDMIDSISILQGDTIIGDSTRYMGMVAVAKSYNSAQTPATVFSTNMQTMMDIYLNSLASGQEVTDSTDLGFIDSLAVKCPYDEGDAVYFARSLFFRYHPLLAAFNDNILCSSDTTLDHTLKLATIRNETADSIIKQIQFARLMPNPASDMTSIIFNTGHLSFNRAEIYDNLGRIIVFNSEMASSGKIDLDLRALPTGVYLVRFTADGKELLSTKLVVKQ